MADGSSSLKLHSSLSNALAMRDLMANWSVDFGKLADKSLAKLWYANVMAAVNSCGSVSPRILETKKDELDALAIEVSKEIVEEINEQVLGERMLKLWSTEKDINELEKKVEEENKKLENRRSTMHVKNASDNDAAAGLFPSIQRRVISLINSRACAMHLSLKKAIASHVDLMVKDRLLKVGDVGSLWLEICRLLFLPHPKLIVGDSDGMNPALRRQAAHKIRAAMIGDVLRKEDTVEAYAMRLLRYSEQLETVGRSVDDEELQTQLYAQLVMQQRYVEDYDKAESEALSKGESVTFDYLWRSVHNRVTMRLMMGLSVDRITGNGSLRGGDIAAAMDDNRWKPSNPVHPSKRYNDDRVCYRCKNPGHILKDCPEPEKRIFKCNRCGEEGHTSSNCEADLEKVKAFKILQKKRGENNSNDSNNDGGKKGDCKKVPASDGSNFINVRIAKVGDHDSDDSDDDQ